MRPYAFTRQPLSQHIKGVVDEVEHMLNSGYDETVFRKLRYAGVELDRDTLREAVLAAAVFHDAGKAVEYYQRQFDEKGECLLRDSPSFYLHEVLSAIYFYRFISSYSHWSNELKILATLTVLNHMHSLRDYGGQQKLFDPQGAKSSLELKIIEGARITGDDLNNLADVITRYGFDGGIVRQCLARAVSYRDDVYELGRELRYFESTSRAIRLYVLLLLPVVVGDVLDAARNRPGEITTNSRRAFVEELRLCLGEGNYV